MRKGKKVCLMYRFIKNKKQIYNIYIQVHPVSTDILSDVSKTWLKFTWDKNQLSGNDLERHTCLYKVI